MTALPRDTPPSLEEAENLKARLASIQKARGYFFNAEETLTLELLQQLLVTRARYGYMACPCRLSNGSYENDKDIICPCAYREADVREFGACYCRLYVSKEWNGGAIPHVLVPERRPPEKILW